MNKHIVKHIVFLMRCLINGKSVKKWLVDRSSYMLVVVYPSKSGVWTNTQTYSKIVKQFLEHSALSARAGFISRYSVPPLLRADFQV